MLVHFDFFYFPVCIYKYTIYRVITNSMSNTGSALTAMYKFKIIKIFRYPGSRSKVVALLQFNISNIDSRLTPRQKPLSAFFARSSSADQMEAGKHSAKSVSFLPFGIILGTQIVKNKKFNVSS